MRSYILTERERIIIGNFLSGKIPRTKAGISQIRTRLKGSKLSEDLDLLIRLREALAKPESVISA